METIWKQVKEFDKYEVSNDGEVRIKSNKKIIVQRISSDGYKKLNFWVNGKPLTRSVHRLVLEAFKEKPKGKNQCNHIDGNKLNNTEKNLEWCTCLENRRHAIKNKLWNGKKRDNKLSDSDVTRILKLLKYRVKQKEIAKHFRVSQPYISEIFHRKKRKDLS